SLRRGLFCRGGFLGRGGRLCLGGRLFRLLGLDRGGRGRVVGRDARRLGADRFLHARLVRAAGKDVGDAHQRQLLPVAARALRGVLAAAFPVGDDLVGL